MQIQFVSGTTTLVLPIYPFARIKRENPFHRFKLWLLYLRNFQHIVALAVVYALRSRDVLHAVPVSIKWPNDIYLDRTDKLGKGLEITVRMNK